MFFNDLNKPLLILCNSDPYTTAFFCELPRTHFFGLFDRQFDVQGHVTWHELSNWMSKTSLLIDYHLRLNILEVNCQLRSNVSKGIDVDPPFGSNVSSKAEIKHLFFWSMVLGLMFQSNAMRSIVFAIIGDIVKNVHIFIKHANHYFTIQTDWIPCWKTFNLSTLV